MSELLPHAPEIRADARNVVDWYKRELAARTHDLSFAQCALHEAWQATALVQDELASVRAGLEELQAQASGPPSLDDPAFGAWVAEHWDAIQDAHLAHAVDHADAPQVMEQP